MTTSEFAGRSHFAKTIGHILADAAYTVTLLLGLVAVHKLVEAGDFSEPFKARFNSVHEFVFLANYMLLTLKGIVRIGMEPWK